MELPVPTKGAVIILIRAKSCKPLLHMLLVCIRSYLISVLRYKFLILDTYHPCTLCWREQGCDDPWLFLEAKRGPRAQTFWETLFEGDNIYKLINWRVIYKSNSWRPHGLTRKYWINAVIRRSMASLLHFSLSLIFTEPIHMLFWATPTVYLFPLTSRFSSPFAGKWQVFLP
jgi:hypothetical protein